MRLLGSTMMRRGARLTLAAVLAAAVVAAPWIGVRAASGPAGFTPLPSNAPFPDVPLTGGLVHATSFLDHEGIMSGFPDGTFQPAGVVTRAQMAKIVATMAGLPQSSAAVHFKDAASIPGWAAPYVAAATAAGILTGYPDGTFRPSASVTEAEILAVLVRALGDGPYVKQLDAKGERWPQDYVDAAAHFALTGSSDGLQVSASQPATRGWTALALYNGLIGAARYTATVSGQTLVSQGGGLWSRNYALGKLPAAVSGKVAAADPISITLDIAGVAGGSGTTKTFPLATSVLYDGGDQSQADVRVGDTVLVALGASGKVSDVLGGHPPAAAPACPPPLASATLPSDPSTSVLPIELAGPAGTLGLPALVSSKDAVTIVATDVLKQLGYTPTDQTFSLPYFNGTEMTGALYNIQAPAMWDDNFWYPMGTATLSVLGVDGLEKYGGWGVQLGQDALKALTIRVQSGLWDVSVPCPAGGG